MKGLARLFGMTEAVWRRHANPWSGWTRAVSGIPLIALAVWSRVWLGWGALGVCALVALWLWLNPRVFPEPKRFDAWMSRGVMGEKVFLNHRAAIPAHHRRMALILAWLSLPGMVVFGWGLWALDLQAVVLGGALAALPKMWFIDRMVWLVADWEAAGGRVWDSEDPRDG